MAKTLMDDCELLTVLGLPDTIIGHHVFHKLNRIESICCDFSWLLVLRIRVVRTRGSVALLMELTPGTALKSTP